MPFSCGEQPPSWNIQPARSKNKQAPVGIWAGNSDQTFRWNAGEPAAQQDAPSYVVQLAPDAVIELARHGIIDLDEVGASSSVVVDQSYRRPVDGAAAGGDRGR